MCFHILLCLTQAPATCFGRRGFTKKLRACGFVTVDITKNIREDLINGRLLKECCDACVPILQLIFQRSLESGTIPNDWHNANVSPLFKKGERYKAANYRPVSLTSICSKLMEHVIASQLTGHLNTNNILYDLQHGFWDKRSCETQLLALVHELAHGVNASK